MSAEIKIKYRFGEEFTFASTAYVSEEPDEHGVHYGTNKYTDGSVKVVWSDALNSWIEVP